MLSSELGSNQLLCIECSGFDGFQELKTEDPVELTIYMFTNPVLDFIQYYLQYLHIVARLLMCYMLCLITLNLTLTSN